MKKSKTGILGLERGRDPWSATRTPRSSQWSPSTEKECVYRDPKNSERSQPPAGNGKKGEEKSKKQQQGRRKKEKDHFFLVQMGKGHSTMYGFVEEG